MQEKKDERKTEKRERFIRSEMLLGSKAMKKLEKAKVAVFGVGGVGGYVVEALARSGVGQLDLIDHDTVSVSNLNRQIIALHSTLGQSKVEVARQRILDINPDAVVNVHETFFLPETANQFDFSKYDYIVDAIDTVSGKIGLVMEANRTATPIISAMGAGNKCCPTAFEVADIYETSVCPLAKVMRKELKKRGIKKLKVVYSKELPISPYEPEELGYESKSDDSEQTLGAKKRQVPGSICFSPSVAGLIIASEVIRDLCFSQEHT